ncbi:MAG: hypothetical protein J6U54_18820 [Clostridiales bacterium]|nr:hypothetical protein [Clostridiales bacterium]
MSLNRFRTQVKKRIDQLDMLINKKTNSLNGIPEGKLIVSNRKYPEFYMVNEKDGTRTYISKSDLELLRKMAQKSYDMKVLKAALKEKKILERMLDKYPQVSMEEYYETLSLLRRRLVSPVWLPDEEFIRKWQEKPFTPNPVEKTKSFKTNRGEFTRSKSEMIIANRLNERGIPYKYEAPLVLNNGEVVYPDFTLLNMNTRTESYWEHCGMMDDHRYADRTSVKLSKYAASGIILGDRLFLTMETGTVPLDADMIDPIINLATGRNRK